MVHIGTSGWNYTHWANGVFYPPGLQPRQWLNFYCQHFDTVEINNTFYRLPGEDVFDRWRAEVPQTFLFAVKASRSLTHMKRLKDPADPLALLLSQVRHLKKSLGPLLFQLPPRFKVNLERLRDFLTETKAQIRRTPLRIALEVRDSSWLDTAVFALLETHGVALCFADWRDIPVTAPVTADFVYVRRHFGPDDGDYGKRALDQDIKRIRKWTHDGRDVYLYFNNDGHGYAIKNARYVRDRLHS